MNEICSIVLIQLWVCRHTVNSFQLHKMALHILLDCFAWKIQVHASAHWIIVLWGWAAGATLMKACHGVSPPWQVTAGILTHWWEPAKQDRRSPSSFGEESQSSSFLYSSVTLLICYLCAHLFLSSSFGGVFGPYFFEHKLLLFHQFSSPSTLIWALFVSHFCQEKASLLLSSVDETFPMARQAFMSSEVSHKVNFWPMCI